ncbi:glycosyltransferase [Mucilaginibacter sp.]|jgi:glycosyltransferase involved in cell wall biosynthesis|uniref:glycosyltransferase n=1 Tax=Mucilaginibacter sp. TaxID=1882438 RepID=UPI003567A6A8
MSIRFVTIVTHVENLELRKDPGQVPYHIGNSYKDFSASLVTYYYTLKGGRHEGPVDIPPQDSEQQHKDYPFLHSEVNGLQLQFLPHKGRGKFYERAVLSYLLKNSKQIDVLNLFHFNAENIFYTLLFKLLHPKGKVYIKLDIDICFYKQNKYFFNTNSSYAWLKVILFTKIIQPLFFRLVHTISAETQEGYRYFIKRFNVPLKKMLLLSNGVDENRISECVTINKNFQQKENIIITVGKIGTRQKNNEMLLDTLNGIELKDWKVYFIGSIEPSFYNTINNFYKKYPAYSESVFFTGKIDDPNKLYEYYNKAKIFCMTSENESFCIAAAEAAFFGNYLILTDTIPSFEQLTNNGLHGKKIKLNDTIELKETLQKLIDDEILLSNNYDAMKNYSSKYLTWQSIIPILNKKLKN